MRKKLMLIGIGIFMTCGITANAQSRRTARDSSTIIIFNQSASSGVSHTKTGETNIIKIAPLGFISGVFPLAYERRITDYFSVQAGGGLTHRNYIRGAIQKENSSGTKIKYTYPWNTSSSDYIDDQAEAIYNFDNRQVKMGYMYSIQPRFYYESEALDGNFVGLSYDFYRYNFEVPGLINGGVKSEHENITDFMVHFGHQAVYDRLTIEWSTGIGLRNVKGEKYVAVDNGSGSIKDGMATYKQTLINLGASFKIGYHF